jgi:23S rRNA (adenine-N6)-dimethyltransferase
MSARGRTDRDRRRRRLGQNFLDSSTAERLIDHAAFRPDDLVIEIGAGGGAITLALARRGARIIAIEPDPDWSRRLRERLRGHPRVRVIAGDFLSFRLPHEPFRVVGALPFGRTTDMLRRLLDDPGIAMQRADLVVQWEVARKRATVPPSTLLSTAWAPWWDLSLGPRIPASEFRPVPRVDGGLLTIRRRDPPLLLPSMARSYADFVQRNWPFSRAEQRP